MSEAHGALAQILDTLVPARGALPGAGELGLAVSLLEEDPSLGPAAEGLAASAAAGHAALVAALERDHPGLLPGLLFRTYTRYYQHPRVLVALGLEARPPFPLGYALEQGDLGGLEAVRARGRRYREV